MAEIDYIEVRQERSLRLLSVVAPMFNEEGTAAVFYERVIAALEGIPFELVLVDDSSRDRTGEIIDGLADRDPRGV